VNHKRLHRMYREAGLDDSAEEAEALRARGKPLLARTSANQEWALDFVHDAVQCGRTIRVLSVVDAYTRECLALGSGHQLRQPESDASAGCDHGGAWAAAGDPLRQRAGVDQPAFSGVVRGTADRVGAHSAGQADAERAGGEFSRTAAGRVFDVSWFQNLFDARRKIAAWRKEYNEERPHSSLGYKTPKEFAAARPQASTELNWGKGLKRRPLAPDPHPGSNRRWSR
jgi:putative transposase